MPARASAATFSRMPSAASRRPRAASVLVQAKSDAARGFYLAQAEFIEHPVDSRVLFLPIETVIAAYP